MSEVREYTVVKPFYSGAKKLAPVKVGAILRLDEERASRMLKRGVIKPLKSGPVVDLSDIDELAPLRERFEELGGEADKRWKEDRLKQEIAKLEAAAK